MGFLDYVSDLYASVTIQSAEAEQPQKDDADSNEEGGEEKSEDSSEESGEEEEGGDDEGGDDEEEEEEEEDEPEDLKPKLEEECLKTAACAPLKHHYDECAERVQHQEETDGKAQEDCVEECKCL